MTVGRPEMRDNSRPPNDGGERKTWGVRRIFIIVCVPLIFFCCFLFFCVILCVCFFFRFSKIKQLFPFCRACTCACLFSCSRAQLVAQLGVRHERLHQLGVGLLVLEWVLEACLKLLETWCDFGVILV